MRILGYILSVFFTLMSISFLYAYNAQDLLSNLLDTNHNDISYTEVTPLLKGIRQNSFSYQLVQKAIAQDIIKNSTRYINLRKEFTRDSVRKTVLVHMGINLDIYGTENIDPDTWTEIIETIKYNQSQSRLIQAEQTKKELVDVLKKSGYTNLSGDNPSAIIEGLDDKYADFFDKTERNLLDELLYGTFEGIGIAINKGEQDSFLTIREVFNETPAAQAGLKQGDHIMSIDNHIIITTDDIVSLSDRIKGPIGSIVHLRIQRGSMTLEKSIKRGRVTIPNVTYIKQDNDTAILQFHQFAVGSYDEFVRYIPRLRRAKTIILDLRNNGGGSVQETNNILNHIIPKNDVLYTIDYGNYTAPMRSQGSYRVQSLRPKQRIILVNNNTASASEIITTTIKNKRPNTLIAGIRTYGKGSMQSVIELSDNSAFKFTSAIRYIGTSTTSINNIGITPDLLRTTLSPTEDTLLNHILGLIE